MAKNAATNRMTAFKHVKHAALVLGVLNDRAKYWFSALCHEILPKLGGATAITIQTAIFVGNWYPSAIRDRQTSNRVWPSSGIGEPALRSRKQFATLGKSAS